MKANSVSGFLLEMKIEWYAHNGILLKTERFSTYEQFYKALKQAQKDILKNINH